MSVSATASQIEKSADDEIIEALQEAVEQDPENVDAYYKLGAMLGKEKKSGAVEAFRCCLNIDPHFKNGNASYLLATILINEHRDYAGAEDALRDAISVNPEIAQGKAQYFYGVIIMNHRDDPEAAEQALSYAVELDPENADAQYRYGLAIKVHSLLSETCLSYLDLLRVLPL